jgi:hypothetical protein
MSDNVLSFKQKKAVIALLTERTARAAAKKIGNVLRTLIPALYKQPKGKVKGDKRLE